ncbi:MAG: ferrous iron transport protein B, partial [SAR324 cluster bacterium]|nr:ferrous iron transport protein B [SAR324 cluster bacterium]
MSHEVTLRHMKNNEKGIITQVNASGELGRRIRDMGLVKQTEITVIGRAPLKDPVALRLKDFTLTLRNKEADHIRVRVEREDEMEEIVKEADLCIALAGNPNAGKTTIFNALTGAKQRVGNYPGVTVAKREGLMNVDGLKVTVADLPGIYSLTPYSEEEIAARIHLIHNRPDGIINVVDANTLERNLYLTIQLLELGIPVVLDLNMIDEVRKKGTEINTAKLASILRIPVVETNGRTGEGKIEMIKEAIRFVREKVGKTEPLYVSYGTDLDEAILRMEKIIIENQFLTETLPPRWIATKLLEKDSHLKAMETKKEDVLEQLLDIVDQVSKHCKNTLNTDPEELIADYRYGYITSILTSDVIVRNDRSGRLEMSDKIDKVVTNTLSGPIIMLVVLYSMFQITFTLGEYPMGWLESLFGLLGTGAKALIPEGILQSLIVSGVIDGVGGVLSFAPLILIMFFMISFLEDSGYMARIAYILDKLMQKVGLHGASVMPYIISGGIVGGCAVPGVMATRTLKSPKEKIATILTAPFLTCGAKTPVVMLLAAAFFPNDGARVLFWTVLCSWAVALLVARLLRSTIIRGESTPFVMELPPYRMPTTRGMLIHTWERTWQYIKKAGTVILAVSVFI